MLLASDIAAQWYCALHSLIKADKIPLKPLGFNNTFDLSKISLRTRYGITLMLKALDKIKSKMCLYHIQAHFFVVYITILRYKFASKFMN